MPYPQKPAGAPRPWRAPPWTKRYSGFFARFGLIPRQSPNSRNPFLPQRPHCPAAAPCIDQSPYRPQAPIQFTHTAAPATLIPAPLNRIQSHDRFRTSYDPSTLPHSPSCAPSRKCADPASRGPYPSIRPARRQSLSIRAPCAGCPKKIFVV